MKQHNIDLSKVTQQGKVVTNLSNDELYMTTTYALNMNFGKSDMPIKHYVSIPNRYQLPLKISMKAKLDSPSLLLILGKGHVNFLSDWQDNRRLGDIIESDYKPHSFHNQLPVNTYVDIEVTYDIKFMQILINGEERYFSKKEKYIKSKQLDDLNKDGFEVKLACSKHSRISIKDLIITEYEVSELEELRKRDSMPEITDVCLGTNKKAKESFESCISLLSKDLQNEMLSMNDYLLNIKTMKFKRRIEGNSQACKITYVSPVGFSYSVIISGNLLQHFMWWYMLSNYKYEDKFMGRKNDYTEAMLVKLADTSPDFADKMFQALKECVSCGYNQCSARTIYEYNGKKKAVCHGKMEFNMCVPNFLDIRRMIETIAELV